MAQRTGLEASRQLLSSWAARWGLTCIAGVRRRQITQVLFVVLVGIHLMRDFLPVETSIGEPCIRFGRNFGKDTLRGC